MNKNTLSVIIPCFNFFNSFKKTFNAVLNQKYQPDEIIIIDSSTNDEIKNFVDDFKTIKVNIIYERTKNKFPGEARNFGVSLSNCYFVSFLDSKTVPDKHWLELSMNLMTSENYDVCFGATKYIAHTNFQKLFNYSSHGNEIFETTPGSIIKKEIFLNGFDFLENVRTADDLEWRNRIKQSNLNYSNINNNYLEYESLPLNLNSALKRYFIYSFHTAFVEVQNNMKDWYLSLIFIFSLLIIPRWNIYMAGLNKNHYLYIPNLTKYYLIITFIILIFFIFLNVRRINNLSNSIKIVFFLIFSYSIYKWNYLIANWVEEAAFYIPHITKIYLLFLFLFVFLYRSFYLPLNRKVSIKEIFPYNWIIVGLIGLSIDLVKMPGYILGGVNSNFISLFKRNFFKNKINKVKKKKILFLNPYPFNSQAGQRFKFEQHYGKLRFNDYSIRTNSFFDMNTYLILYKKHNTLNKVIGTIKGYIRRVFLIFNLRNYDYLYVHMWVVPFGGPLFEKIYRFFGKKLIYDFEDNILSLNNYHYNSISDILRKKNKIVYLIKNYDNIITSSKYLELKSNEISKKNNCKYICASIDTKRFNVRKNHIKKDVVNIGWTGTYTTIKYLKLFEKTLFEINKIRKIKLIVIGNFEYNNTKLISEFIHWNHDTEIQDLLKLDIGLYPIQEDEWSKGKSGLKALQYMALGIPCIATNFGNIKKIISNNINGYLINDDQQLYQTLINLIDNHDLRNKIGNNSIKLINKSYSIDAINQQYLDVIEN